VRCVPVMTGLLGFFLPYVVSRAAAFTVLVCVPAVLLVVFGGMRRRARVTA
jgi:hypothetical protein